MSAPPPVDSTGSTPPLDPALTLMVCRTPTDPDPTKDTVAFTVLDQGLQSAGGPVTALYQLGATPIGAGGAIDAIVRPSVTTPTRSDLPSGTPFTAQPAISLAYVAADLSLSWYEAIGPDGRVRGLNTSGAGLPASACSRTTAGLTVYAPFVLRTCYFTISPKTYGFGPPVLAIVDTTTKQATRTDTGETFTDTGVGTDPTQRIFSCTDFR